MKLFNKLRSKLLKVAQIQKLLVLPISTMSLVATVIILSIINVRTNALHDKSSVNLRRTEGDTYRGGNRRDSRIAGRRQLDILEQLPAPLHELIDKMRALLWDWYDSYRRETAAERKRELTRKGNAEKNKETRRMSNQYSLKFLMTLDIEPDVMLAAIDTFVKAIGFEFLRSPDWKPS